MNPRAGLVKRTLILLLLSAFSLSSYGQSLSRSAISSYGTIGQSGNPSLSATLGQSASATFASSNHFLTQGFEQPKLISVGFVELISSSSLRVYPVPSYDRVTIELLGNRINDYQIMMVDLSGKTINPDLLFEERLGDHSVSYNIQGLSAGIYHLVFTQKETQKRITARILKIE